MTTFTRTWDTSYKGNPQDTDDSSEGAGHLRNIKEDVYERMIVDHSWAGDTNDGKHQKVTLMQLPTDPTLDTGDVALYAKPVGSKSQLFFKDQDGNAIQLTFAGQGQSIPAGVVVPYAGVNPPGGYLLCFGQTVSQTTYPALYAVCGTTYGPAVGGNFTLPDLRGRVIAGKDNMGGTPAGRLTAAVAGSTLGASGGEQQHTLVVAEMPSHNHGVTDPGHGHGSYSVVVPGASVEGGQVPPNSTWLSSSITIANATTGITIQNTGTGSPHNVVQPTLVLNFIIKT